MFRNRGGGGPGFRGKPKAGGFRDKGAGGGNFRGGRNFEVGPPERVIPLGTFEYPCADDLVCKVKINDVPYFNAPIYLENKEQIGKIDEIFGTVKDYAVTIKLSDTVKASSFKPQQQLFIDPQKLLPIGRFLPKPPQPKGPKKKGPTGGVGGSRAGNRPNFGQRGGFGSRGSFVGNSGGAGGKFGGRGGAGARNFNKFGGKFGGGFGRR